MLPAALRARFAPGWRHQLGRLAQAHPSLSRPRCAPPEPQLPDPGCSADGANLGPSAAGMDAGQLDVKAPLRDRPPRHIVELSDLMAWRRRAESHIKEVGNSLLLADGGPSASELKIRTKEVSIPQNARSIEPHGLSATEKHCSSCCAFHQSWNSYLLFGASDRELQALDKFHGDPIAPLDETQWRSARQQELHATHQAGSLTGQGSVNEQGKVLMRLNMEDLNDLWRKRVKERVPIQYITHTAHWRDLVLAVGPGVLVPRPETELIIDFVADVLDAHPDLRHCPWADLGTGSGALAIGLAKLLCRPSSVWAVDLSPIAVRYAKFNVARCDAASAVHVMEGSWFKPLANFRGKLGGVVCNPPYIPSGVLGGLQAEVRQHEPQLALDGGAEEGKGRLQEVVAGAADFLIQGGVLILETHGGKQAHDVADAMQSAAMDDSATSFSDVSVVQDYDKVDRFVLGFKRK